jgi:hypothetical protein
MLKLVHYKKSKEEIKILEKDRSSDQASFEEQIKRSSAHFGDQNF